MERQKREEVMGLISSARKVVPQSGVLGGTWMPTVLCVVAPESCV